MTKIYVVTTDDNTFEPYYFFRDFKSARCWFNCVKRRCDCFDLMPNFYTVYTDYNFLDDDYCCLTDFLNDNVVDYNRFGAICHIFKK